MQSCWHRYHEQHSSDDYEESQPAWFKVGPVHLHSEQSYYHPRDSCKYRCDYCSQQPFEGEQDDVNISIGVVLLLSLHSYSDNSNYKLQHPDDAQCNWNREKHCICHYIFIWFESHCSTEYICWLMHSLKVK